MKFKVGDKIVYTPDKIWKAVVIAITDYSMTIIWNSGCESTYTESSIINCFELISNKTEMNLKESFAAVFKQEPQKSFNKAGITDSNDTLTSDGQAIFLSWLLQQNGDAFKTAVVDPILAEQEKK